MCLHWVQVSEEREREGEREGACVWVTVMMLSLCTPLQCGQCGATVSASLECRRRRGCVRVCGGTQHARVAVLSGGDCGGGVVAGTRHECGLPVAADRHLCGASELAALQVRHHHGVL